MSRYHETMEHSVGEYVRCMSHTNGMELLWSMRKRAHNGTFLRINPKHLNHYVQEFAGKHNRRRRGTIDKMAPVVAGMIGNRRMSRELISDT